MRSLALIIFDRKFTRRASSKPFLVASFFDLYHPVTSIVRKEAIPSSYTPFLPLLLLLLLPLMQVCQG